MMTKRLLSLSFVSVLASACGGGGSSSVSVDQLDSEINKAYCEYQVNCGGMPDQATCLASLQPSSADILTLQADVKSGKSTYNGSKAGACVDDYKNLSCDLGAHTSEITKLINDCSAIATGTAAAGAACFFDTECASGNICNSSQTCTAGTCVAKPAAVAHGGDCSAAGATCASASDVCVQTASGATCQSPVADGQACSGYGSSECVEGDECQEDFSQSTPTAKCGKPLAEGATCNPNIYPQCANDLFCASATMKCTKVLAVGATCVPNDFGCVYWANCDQTSMKCVELGKSGDTCDPNAQAACLGDMSCDMTSMKCTLGTAPTACM